MKTIRAIILSCYTFTGIIYLYYEVLYMWSYPERIFDPFFHFQVMVAFMLSSTFWLFATIYVICLIITWIVGRRK